MAQACKIFLSLTLEAEAGGVQGQFNWSTEGVPRQQGRHNPSLEKKQNTLKKNYLLYIKYVLYLHLSFSF